LAEDESELVKLAKEAIFNYIRYGRVISPPDNPPPEMMGRAGVFVSIKKRGRLRGCIGTIEPTQPNVAGEIIQNAISSSTKDYRFPPIGKEELDDLSVSVDVLTPPEMISSLAQLDPKQYGVIVKKGHRRGLLLPDLEGVESAPYQVEIAKRKAGIELDEEGVELFRFEVKRYK
jgi:AmmeMemoRadiSam system protein A